MNIKESIGERIAEVRKERHLTLSGLSELTGFSVGRISNWERGRRSPGPEEAAVLADALHISAAYLLCLIDTKNNQEIKAKNSQVKLIPLFSAKTIEKDPGILEADSAGHTTRSSMQLTEIPIGEQLIENIGTSCYAIVLDDSSMQSDFMPEDIIILDPNRKPQPSNFILAFHNKSKTLCFRKYRKNIDDKGKEVIELIPLNPDWPTQRITDPKSIKILGVMVEFRRIVT